MAPRQLEKESDRPCRGEVRMPRESMASDPTPHLGTQGARYTTASRSWPKGGGGGGYHRSARFGANAVQDQEGELADDTDSQDYYQGHMFEDLQLVDDIAEESEAQEEVCAA